MNESKFLICTRCGSRIRREQRNCLKCGQLNFENPDNDYMKKYEKKYNKSINKDAIVKNLFIYNNERPNEVLANNTGNVFLFTIVNALIFLISLVMVFHNGLSNGFNIDFIILLIKIVILYLELFSFQLLLMKANKPWWYGFIIFSILFLFVILFNFLKVKLLIFIFLFLIFFISYNIGQAFGKNPWICIIFAPIMLPIVAFSDMTSYNGVSYIIVGNKHNTFELLNKYNRVILFFNVALILIGVILLFFSFVL